MRSWDQGRPQAYSPFNRGVRLVRLLLLAGGGLLVAEGPALASNCEEVPAPIVKFNGHLDLNGAGIGSPSKICAQIPAPATVTVSGSGMTASGLLRFYTNFFFDPDYVNASRALNSITFDQISIAAAAVADTPFLEILPLPVSNQVAATDVNLINVDIGANRSIHLTQASGATRQRQSVYITSTTARTYDRFRIENATDVLIGYFKSGSTFTKVATRLTLKDSVWDGIENLGIASGSSLTLDNATLNAGITRLDGTLAGNGTINGAAGSGSSTNFLVASGAVFEPGQSIGTLFVNGTLDFQGQALMISELNPLAAQNADLLSVSGAVSGLNNLYIQLEKDSSYAGSNEIADFIGATYVVLDGGSFNQDGVTLVEGSSLNAHLSASLVANPTVAGQVEVQFTDNSPTPTYLPSKIRTTGTGKAVSTSTSWVSLVSALSATHSGTTVNGAGGGNGGSQVLAGGSTLSSAWLSLTNANLQQLNQVHAEPYSSNLTVGLEQLDLVAGSVMNRISGSMAPGPAGAVPAATTERSYWVDTQALRGNVEGEGGLGTFGYTLASALMGADLYADDSQRLGVFGGYAYHGMNEHDAVRQDFSAHTGLLGGYGTWTRAGWEFAWVGGYGLSDQTARRFTPDVGSFTGGTAKADFLSHSVFTSVQVKRDLALLDRLRISPFLAASYAQVWQGEAREQGGGDFSFRIHEAEARALVTGGGFEWSIAADNAVLPATRFFGVLRYDHDWEAARSEAHEVTATSDLFGSFRQAGQNRGAHSLGAGFGFEGLAGNRIAWRAGLSGSVHEHGAEVGGAAHLRWTF